MKHKSYIDSKSYRIKDTGSYIRVNGWYLDDSGQSAQFSAEINGPPRPDQAQTPAPSRCRPAVCPLETGGGLRLLRQGAGAPRSAFSALISGRKPPRAGLRLLTLGAGNWPGWPMTAHYLPCGLRPGGQGQNSDPGLGGYLPARRRCGLFPHRQPGQSRGDFR